MREEIEAAVTFLTRLLAKSVTDPGGGGGGGGKDSSSSSTTTSNGLINNNNSSSGNNNNNNSNNSNNKDQTTTNNNNNNNKNDHQNFNNNNHNNNQQQQQTLTEDKIKKFSQKLIDILTQRFQNHWYPGHPSKGQAYRCIRINQNCRVDCSIELACQQVGISYEALRLPVELTLWIDPSEVTCRFGEHKGSFCIVAKLGDGRQENFADSINIDELEQRSIDRSKQSFENSRMKMKPLHATQRQLMSGHHVTSAKQVARNQVTIQAQSPIMNPFSSTTLATSSTMNNVSYHAMNGGVNSLQNGGLTSQQHNHLTSHGSPVGGGAGSMTNGFAMDFTLGASSNGLPGTVFGPVGGAGGNASATGGLAFQPTPGAAGGGTGSQPFQYSPAAQYFNHFHLPPQAAAAAANFQHHPQQAAVVAALHPNASWSPNSHLFGATATNKFMAGLTAAGSPQQNHPTSSTPPSTSVSGGAVGQLQVGGRQSLSSNHMSSSMTPGGQASFRSIQVNNNNSLTSSSVSTSSTLATSQVSTSNKSNSQQQLSTTSNNILSNGGLTNNNTNNNNNNNNGNSNNSSSNNNGGNNNTGGGANPNAPIFIPRSASGSTGANFLHNHLSGNSPFNISASPFTPSSLANNFQSIDQAQTNGSSAVSSAKDRRSAFVTSNVTTNVAAVAATSPSSVAASNGSPATATGTPLVANNRF